jgi:hypothetical protein
MTIPEYSGVCDRSEGPKQYSPPRGLPTGWERTPKKTIKPCRGETNCSELHVELFVAPLQGLKCLGVCLPRALPWAILPAPFRGILELSGMIFLLGFVTRVNQIHVHVRIIITQAGFAKMESIWTALVEHPFPRNRRGLFENLPGRVL